MCLWEYACGNNQVVMMLTRDGMGFPEGWARTRAVPFPLLAFLAVGIDQACVEQILFWCGGDACV